MSEKSATVSNLYQVFLKECALYNKSPATFRSYEYSKKHLFRVMPKSASMKIGAINKAFVTDYTAALSDKGLAISTINHYLRDLRVFLYWCMENEYIVPYKIVLIKEKPKVQDSYTRDELKVLLRAPHRDASFSEWRTWAVVNWLMSYGSRASTIVSVHVEDVDLFGNHVIMRHNKNNRTVSFPISKDLKAALTKYRRVVSLRSEDVANSVYMFPAESGR